jgi:uncharacterized membrane protein
VVFWILYDAICQWFGQRKNGDAIVGALVLLLVCVASWLACHWFAGRAAFLLVGAMIATAMSANVFFWIIPGQKKVIASIKAGEPVDPIHGMRGKQRSVHNTYFTLPVLFAMLSNHYSFLYTHKLNWVVLILMMFAGAAIRQFFVMRHGWKLGTQPHPAGYALVGVAVIAATIAWLARTPARCQGAGFDGELRLGAEGAGAALLHVPRRAGADEERAARHARGREAACAGGVPAGGGGQDHADEQRDADHRSRARADRAVVPGRRQARLSYHRVTASQSPQETDRP